MLLPFQHHVPKRSAPVPIILTGRGFCRLGLGLGLHLGLGLGLGLRLAAVAVAVAVVVPSRHRVTRIVVAVVSIPSRVNWIVMEAVQRTTEVATELGAVREVHAVARVDGGVIPVDIVTFGGDGLLVRSVSG